MSLQALLKDAQGSTSGGASGLSKLVADSSPISQKLMQAQNDAINAQQESKNANSFGGLISNTLKGVGNTIYDAVGGLVLPGATHDELRNTSLLKDTVLGLPKAALNTAATFIQHPLQSAQSAVGGATRGVSDEVTSIITNLFVKPEERDAVTQGVKDILDKYLGTGGTNTAPNGQVSQSDIQGGFKAAGQAAPYIAAGGVLGDLGGATGEGIGARLGQTTGSLENGMSANLANAKIGGTIGRTLGSAAGFVGVGQASLPIGSSLEVRARKATQDLAGLGLFAIGSEAYNKAKGIIQQGIMSSETPTQPAEPKIGLNKLVSEAQSKVPRPPSPLPFNREPAPFFGSESGSPGEVAPQPIEGGGETKTRALAQGVEAKAIENKLVTTLGDLPQYKTVNWADQANKADEIASKDYEQAKRIATGDETAPNGVLPEAIFTAVENRATKEGDVETLRALGTGKLTEQATTMGQRIGILSQRNPDSPVTAIEDVAKARREALKVKDPEALTRQTIRSIKSEIRKTAPTKQTWSDFVDSIQC